MLVIGRSLTSQSKLMLVDEASLGLAPIAVAALFDAISRINAEQYVSMLLLE